MGIPMNIRNPTFARMLGALAATCVLALTAACSQVADWFTPPGPPAAEPVALTCPTQAGGPVTLVVGARANSPRPDLPIEIQGLVREAAKTSSEVQVVQVDGAPKVTLEATFRTTAQSPEAQQRELEKFTENFATLLRELKPKQPEADVFEALRTAALATPSGGTIVLVDSGIPTKGQLSFLEGDLFGAAEKPDEVTGYLTANRLLPDLSGRSVVLVNVGQTAEPQAELNENLRTRVVSLWEDVASAAGASCTQSLAGAPARESAETDGVGVTTVPLPADPVFKPCSETMLTDGGPVGFKGDLAGRVKRILVSQGVDADRITTEGAGNQSKYHVPDVGPDGTLLPGPAAENRRVVVQLSCSSG